MAITLAVTPTVINGGVWTQVTFTGTWTPNTVIYLIVTGASWSSMPNTCQTGDGCYWVNGVTGSNGNFTISASVNIPTGITTPFKVYACDVPCPSPGCPYSTPCSTGNGSNTVSITTGTATGITATSMSACSDPSCSAPITNCLVPCNNYIKITWHNSKNYDQQFVPSAQLDGNTVYGAPVSTISANSDYSVVFGPFTLTSGSHIFCPLPN